MVTDNRGFYNLAVIAYWPSKNHYDQWKASSGFEKWWAGIHLKDQKHGWFLEVFYPTMDRLETIFTSEELVEGTAHMKESMSGQIRHHAYWDSTRDRLPVSQTVAISGEKANLDFKAAVDGTFKREDRARIPGKHNLTVIR